MQTQVITAFKLAPDLVKKLPVEDGLHVAVVVSATRSDIEFQYTEPGASVAKIALSLQGLKKEEANALTVGSKLFFGADGASVKAIYTAKAIPKTSGSGSASHRKETLY